jgi:hypothetical protein
VLDSMQRDGFITYGQWRAASHSTLVFVFATR